MITIDDMMITIDDMINRFDGSIGYITNSKEICQYIADLLKELKERRKAPEIIRCKDCRHYEWMDNRIPEEQTWHCHVWDNDTGKDDFCSYAERRTNE